MVVCCRCGHEQGAGARLTRFSWPDNEDETARAARVARHRYDARVRKRDSDAITLRDVRFPIYAAEGWPLTITGSESHDGLTKVTIGHFADTNADLWEAPIFKITTAIEKAHQGERDQSHYALEMWLQGQDDYSGPKPDDLSDAAIKLWFAARRRDRHAAVQAAVASELEIIVDGRPQTFLTLSTPMGQWVGSRRHGRLVITIAASSLDTTSLTLKPIPDLRAQLLGPNPQDPSPT